jgi:hypothetical protein
MSKTKSVAVLLALALVTAAVVPAAASAAAALETDVEQSLETGEATVTVTQNGTAVENATVVVNSSSAYAGNGTYTTDANGTVTLSNPNETVTVALNVTSNDSQSSTSVELVPREDSLDVTLAQNEDGSATATVTQYDQAVENASIELSADGGYADNRTFQTDANGTVEFAQPEDTQNVTVTATYDGLNASDTAELAGDLDIELEVEQEDAGVTAEVTRNGSAVENATVSVSSGGNYSGDGTYETGENGTVALPAPTENVTVNVTATFEDDEVSTTTTLTTEFVEEERNFGQAVTRFIDALRQAGFNGPPGRIISDFVTENNPGNADNARDEAPGQMKKDDAAEKGDAADNDDAAEKGDAADKEKKQGPPEHANNDKGKHGEDADDSDADEAEEEADEDDAEEDDAEEDDADEDEDADEDAGGDDAEEDDDSDGGPPEHANNNGK